MVKTKRMKQEKQMMQMKKAPVGVQIISVLYYIGAVLSALLGLIMIIMSNYIASYLTTTSDFSDLGVTLGNGFFIASGIILIGIGVLGFFVGRGLWKLKSWARIVAIIFSILGILSAVYSMVQDFMVREVINIVIHGVIVYYLLFSSEVRSAFK